MHPYNGLRSFRYSDDKDVMVVFVFFMYLKQLKNIVVRKKL